MLARFRVAIEIVVVGAISSASSAVNVWSCVTRASYLIALSSDIEVEVSLASVLKALIFCWVLVKVIVTDDLTRIACS